jgi:hypothetical protein
MWEWHPLSTVLEGSWSYRFNRSAVKEVKKEKAKLTCPFLLTT